MFGFFECENDPEAAHGAARRRRGVAAGPRPRPDGRPDGLHHQRRVRRPDRRLRPVSDDPHQLAAPLLPGADRGRRASARRWTCTCGTSRSRIAPASTTRSGRSASDVEAKHGITVRSMRKKDMEAEINRFLEVYNAAWERNWGFVPLTEDEVRALRQGPQADPRRELGVRRREGRRDGRRGADAARLQPGADAPERPAAAVRLGQGAVVPAQDRPRPRVRARRQARVAAHRDRRQVLRAALRLRGPDAADRRRDGLDPRDQQVDEPRDGGHGRPDRPYLPGLREDLFEHDRMPLSTMRCHYGADERRTRISPSRRRWSGAEETVDGLPVLAEVRTIERVAPVALPAVQAAAAAATGFRRRAPPRWRSSSAGARASWRAPSGAARSTCCRSSAAGRSSSTSTWSASPASEPPAPAGPSSCGSRSARAGTSACRAWSGSTA